MTRTLRLSLLLFTLSGALVAVGCAPNNNPTAYNETTQANFMEGCTGNFPGSGTTLASNTYCECAYQVFVKNMSIDDFNKLNSELKDDQSKLPQNVQTGLQQCPGWGLPPGASPSEQGPSVGTTPGSTAPPGSAPIS
jgi:hypothetical protein